MSYRDTPYLSFVASLCAPSPRLSWLELSAHQKQHHYFSCYHHLPRSSGLLRLSYWVEAGHLLHSRYRLNLLKQNDLIEARVSPLPWANPHKVGKRLNHIAFSTATFTHYSKEHCCKQVRATVWLMCDWSIIFIDSFRVFLDFLPSNFWPTLPSLQAVPQSVLLCIWFAGLKKYDFMWVKSKTYNAISPVHTLLQYTGKSSGEYLLNEFSSDHESQEGIQLQLIFVVNPSLISWFLQQWELAPPYSCEKAAEMFQFSF